MIPKDLHAIEWSDILALISTGREEDDTIEFKAGFKNGDDYIALSDGEKGKALDSIAREVIAFLNTRGGDVIIGLQEKSGDHPRAEAIRLVKRPQESADRIARGLAAIVEPAQTNVGIRAFSSPSDADQGVIVIRVRPSLRAPHRSKRTLEVLARRGTESVPMPMDEIQDLTLYRSRIRQERQDLLEQQFDDLRKAKSEHHSFGANFVHLRTVFFPLTEHEIELNGDVLGSLTKRDPKYFDKSNPDGKINDVAFRGVFGNWRPILRGRKLEDHATRGQGFKLASIRIKESGIATFDFASRFFDDENQLYIYYDWVIGYLARISDSAKRLIAARPTLAPAVLRVGLHVNGAHSLVLGETLWQESYALGSQVVFLPDFLITSEGDANEFFRQAQIDIMSIVGEAEEAPYTLEAP